MATISAEERRKKVFTGTLAPDFLRITPSTSAGSANQVDLATAEQLQQEMNQAGGQQAIQLYHQAFIPPNTRGRLSITIASARLAKNYGLVRMDPYCRLRVGNTYFETPTDVSGGKAPKWNRTVHCYLPEGVDSVLLEIFDERAFTEDERIAWTQISIPQAVFNCETIDEWYGMTGKEGEGKEGMVNVILAFAPVDGPPVSYIPVTHPGVLYLQQPQTHQQPQHQQQQQQQQQSEGGQQDQQDQLIQTQADVDVNAGPLFTDEDVKELSEMFPAVEEEVVRSVLDEKRGNKDAAVNALLSMNPET